MSKAEQEATAEPRLMSRAAYARRRHCSRAYVTQLIAQGKIHVADGLIDSEQADRQLQQNVAPRHRASSRPGVSFLEARTMSELYKARLARLQYDKMTGVLVEVDKVQAAAEKAFSTVRQRMRSLGKSLAPILASQSQPAAVEKILSEAIDSALESLSTDVFKA